MSFHTIAENVLYRAFILASLAEAEEHLGGLVAAFERCEAEKRSPEQRGVRGLIQKWRKSMAESGADRASFEAGEAFEGFCGRPGGAAAARIILRRAGHILDQKSLAGGVKTAALHGNEAIMREALSLIDPPRRAKVLRAAWFDASRAHDASFAAMVDCWAKSLEEQDILEALPAPDSLGSHRAKLRI